MHFTTNAQIKPLGGAFGNITKMLKVHLVFVRNIEFFYIKPVIYPLNVYLNARVSAKYIQNVLQGYILARFAFFGNII